MVERQKVEALLAMAQSVAPADAVFGEERIGVEGSTLAALCRAWLAVDEAPVTKLDWSDFNRGLHIDDDRMTPYAWETHLTGQRVRIVKEVGDD